MSESLLYLGVKAVAENGEEAFYEPIEVASLWSKWLKVSFAQRALMTLIVVFSIGVCCIFCRRMARKGFRPLDESAQYWLFKYLRGIIHQTSLYSFGFGIPIGIWNCFDLKRYRIMSYFPGFTAAFITPTPLYGFFITILFFVYSLTRINITFNWFQLRVKFER